MVKVEKDQQESTQEDPDSLYPVKKLNTRKPFSSLPEATKTYVVYRE